MQFSFPTVHFSPMFGSDLPLTSILDAAATAGWTSVGVDQPTVDDLLGAERGLDDLGPLLTTRGLTCSDVVALVVTSDRAANRTLAVQLADLVRSTGAAICVAAFVEPAGAVDATPLSVFIDRLAECAEVVNDAGARIALEFLPYSPVDDPSSALRICAAIGLERVGLLIDSWHVFVGGHLDACRRLSAESIAMVQFSDGVAVPPTVDVREASRCHRLLPGRGEFALNEFVDVVRATGFDGVVAPEVLSRDLRGTHPDRVAADLYDACHALWAV